MYFSVIVPIYGIEKYLRQCVESVLSQSFREFELILVDDGSPDDCPAICDEYKEKDSRIKVIHKKNGGLVSARQAGLELAEGEYIVNIDGDDWVDSDYLEKAKDIIEKYHPDIIAFGLKAVFANRTEHRDELIEPGFYDEKALSEKLLPKVLMTPDMEHMHYFLCSKVYRHGAVYDFQMKVDKAISFGEDLAVSVPAYFAAKSVYVSDKAMYNYRQRSDSMSNDFKPSLFKDLERLIIHLRGFGFSMENADAIDRYGAAAVFVLIITTIEAGTRNAAAEIKACWCGVFDDVLEKAEFNNITIKTRIAMGLLKKKCIGTVYYFLRICKSIKGILGERK